MSHTPNEVSFFLNGKQVPAKDPAPDLLLIDCLRSPDVALAGLFVQHCHILDHEDQGMMELVEIKDPNAKRVAGNPAAQDPTQRVARPFAAPPLALPDEKGAVRQLAEFRGQPTVLFFFKDAGCLHCSAQIAQFRKRAEEFRSLGVNLVGVTTETVEGLAAAQEGEPTWFPIVSDAKFDAFRAYGVFRGEPRHGTFILDADGAVRWKAVGDSPFMVIETVLAEAARLGASASPTAAERAASRPLAANR